MLTRHHWRHSWALGEGVCVCGCVRVYETYLMGPPEETPKSKPINDSRIHRANTDFFFFWSNTKFQSVQTSFSRKLTETLSFGTFFAITVTMTWDSVWYQSCLNINTYVAKIRCFVPTMELKSSIVTQNQKRSKTNAKADSTKWAAYFTGAAAGACWVIQPSDGMTDRKTPPGRNAWQQQHTKENERKHIKISSFERLLLWRLKGWTEREPHCPLVASHGNSPLSRCRSQPCL